MSDHSQLRELFVAACDLPAAEQDAFVDEHCSDHPELRTELKRLLASDGETEGFFSDGNTTAGVAFHFDTVVDGESTDAGRYELLGEIARGGMGAILEGRDIELGRDLAIKVLLDEHKDNPQIVQRFLEEAQIAGQLQHPGIAPIYEVGRFPDKRPFISMKLIKGETLATLLKKRNNPADDRGKFLGIFEQICQTMAYAHSRGVIHRDLKPANIMVGAFGEVQVMDWGLAKVTTADFSSKSTNTESLTNEVLKDSEESDRVQTLRHSGSESNPVGSPTQSGSVMGTLAYMPPEQALGQNDRLDQRSDVFSLGAILAEILTGHQIYVSQNASQLMRMASQGDLVEGFERLDNSDADSELIALTKKCLAIDPEHRPQDGNILASKVSDYLKSVETRLRETELERASQTARANEERKRRKVTMALAATILLATVLGAIGWATLQKQKADAFANAQTRINKLVSSARLHQSRAEAANEDTDPDWALQVRELQLSLNDAREAADMAKRLTGTSDGESNLRSSSKKLVSELELQSEKAINRASQISFDKKLLKELELIRLTNGRGENAESLWSAGTENDSRDYSTEQLLFDSRDASVMYERVFSDAGFDVALQDIDSLTLEMKKSGIRESLIGALDNWARALQPEENPSSQNVTLSRLIALVNSVDDNAWRKELRAALSKGDIDLLQTIAAGEKVAEQPSELVCWVAGALRSKREFEKSVAVIRKAQQQNPDDFWINYELGTSLSLIDGQEAEGLAYMRAALAIRPRSTGMLVALSRVLLGLERFEEAEVADRRAIELDANFSHAHVNLGNADYARKRFDDALEHYGKAIEIDPAYARPFGNSGACYFEKGLYEEAQNALEKAIELDPDAARAHGSLGDVLLKLGDLDNAIAQFQKMNEIDPYIFSGYFSIGQCLMMQRKPKEAILQYEKVLEYDPEHAKAYAGLANAYATLGQVDKSINANRRAIELDPGYVKAYGNLGNGLLQQNKLDEALEQFKKALELDPEYSYGHFAIAYVLQSRGDIDGAITEYRKALAINPDFGEVHVNLGLLLKERGEFDAAMEHYRHALTGNPSVQAAANAHQNIGNCFEESGDLEKAVAEYRKAIEIRPDYASHHYALGNVLELQGKSNEAAEALRTATGIKPASVITVTAHYNLGMILDRNNKTDEAIDEFRACIKLQPGYVNGHAALGLALHKKGMSDEATLALDRVLAIAPDNTQLHGQIAVSILGRTDENGVVAGLKDATRFANLACEADPEDRTYLSALGIAYFRSEQWDRALKTLNKAVLMSTTIRKIENADDLRIENSFYLAMTHWQMGNKDEARKMLEETSRWREKTASSGDLQRLIDEATKLIVAEVP